MYSPTARIQLADGTELRAAGSCASTTGHGFDAGRCKTEVVQKLMLGRVGGRARARRTTPAEPIPMIAVYRVTDGLIAEVRFRV